ncbi:hypothetical protein COLO4_35595 [Corchorus olitorius]|uniref:Uncharacterized protein n=1 Tax=Corchorus olitorius TaxID=93759 RepID=A0A1R3GET1_9ROSI|nr:hypothetical protein COLO4_35595 [Corchorus olitorius]
MDHPFATEDEDDCVVEESSDEGENSDCSNVKSTKQLAKEIGLKLDLLKNSEHVTPNYCIFRIPSKLCDQNLAAYFPQYAHIGPLVYYEFVSRHEEDDKRIYLASFLQRAKEAPKQNNLNDFIALIKKALPKIRGCYERTYYRYYDPHSDKMRQNKRAGDLDSLFLIEMILTDAAFIIELFLRAYSKDWRKENDAIFTKLGTMHDIKQDLILLQNQLPLFLLRDMYELAFITGNNPDFPSFLHVTCHFFSHYYNQNISIKDMLSTNNDYRSKLEEAKHFTDLVRTFQHPYSNQNHCNCINEEYSCISKWIIPIPNRIHQYFMHLIIKSKKPVEDNINDDQSLLEDGKVQGEYLYSAVLLREAGVKFRVSQSKCLFDIVFDEKKGELKIPPIRVDGWTESFFGNLMVWEQCSYPDDSYICDYIFLMAYLIKSAEDVHLLVQKRIIINQLGNPKAVVTLFNLLSKHIKGDKNRYSTLFAKLNAYNAVRHHSWIAILKLQYFSTLWKGVATIAAVILLALTFIQTICAIISLI